MRALRKNEGTLAKTPPLFATPDRCEQLPLNHSNAVRSSWPYMRLKFCTAAPGNRWLKRTLTEAAWAASHSKNSYLAAQFHRLLKSPVEYRDLGRDYFDRLQPERLRRYLVKRRESLGYEVTLSPGEFA
jgi:hypothetical protein